MTGTKASGNKHSIPINPETELGEAVESIISPKGYGTATFFMMEFLEKHKDELIAFWDGQGKDGKATFDKWFKKWSLKREEQDAIKDEKDKEKHSKLVKQYEALGENSVNAENFASLFPDSNPLDIVRGKTYNVQNDKEHKIEEEKEQKAKLAERLRKPSQNEKTLSILENAFLLPEERANAEFMAKREKAIADLKQKIALENQKT